MKKTILGAALLTLAGALASAPVMAKEYLLATTKPNQLHIVDAKARKIERSITVPDSGPGVLSMALDEKNKIVYMVTNHWGSVSGIDLTTGKQVFRADLQEKSRRVRIMQGLELSPDGKELYVNCSPVKFKLGEYEVEDTYIAVLNTADGLESKPVRTFPTPRRTLVLFGSNDGEHLYGLGHDLHVFNPKTGERLPDIKLRNWDRENASPPDILDFWNQWEQADMFSTPYVYANLAAPEDSPEFIKMGMLTVDLETKEVAIDDYENFEVIIFSTAVNPVRRNEAYGVYTQLSKIDLEKDELVKRIDMDHTYYTVNVSGDGSELYAAGTMNDIAIYDTETLEKLGEIVLPGGDMSVTSVRMIDL